ncbi:ABC transporter permease subunit [Halomontanus rarus]|uniref:ABC transporter permease subunit n=1 Tax=Halomontanus rarus TaxID=3034020 RepID=UPI0023E8E0AD|nr:ABC transporter permease subunit [Halovivax sp. TS33]
MNAELLLVARKDFEDAVRSKMLWSLMGLLVLVMTLVYYVEAQVNDSTAVDSLLFLGQLLQIVVPVSALLVGYMAVVRERQSGSIKFLLGLPPTRRDVIFGKLIGRAGVIGLGIIASFGVAIVLSMVLFGSIPTAKLGAMAGLTVLLGLAFVGFSVGVSASVSTRGRAMALAIGLYLVFIAFWPLLTGGLYHLLYSEGPGVESEAWYLLYNRLNPLQAYADAASASLGGAVADFSFVYGIRDPDARAMTAAERVGGDVPFYLQDWFAIVILALWATVPVALGYLRFRSIDLG